MIRPDHARQVRQCRAKANKNENDQGRTKRRGQIKGADHDIARHNRQKPDGQRDHKDGQEQAGIGQNPHPVGDSGQNAFDPVAKACREQAEYPAINKRLALPPKQQDYGHEDSGNHGWNQSAATDPHGQAFNQQQASQQIEDDTNRVHHLLDHQIADHV